MKIIKNSFILISIFISVFKSQAMTTAPPDSEKCNIMISFISIGEGTDYKAKEKLDAYLIKKETDGIKFSLDKFRWGREGEEDYCLKLYQLNKKAMMQIIEDIKKMFSGNKLILIEENSEPKHKAP